MSIPVFSESLNSSDHIPANSTEPFSQVLHVSDSDETLFDDGDKSGLSSRTNTEQLAVVDLTRLSISTNELSSTKASSSKSEDTSCSLIEISDSPNSTPTLNCSTLNSNRSEISTCARGRLNDFFDNIPNSARNTSLTKPEKFVEKQLSENSFHPNLSDNSNEVTVNETQPPDRTSTGNHQLEEYSANMQNWNVNISAKIKIKVQVSEVVSESSSESEQDVEHRKQSKENVQSCNQEMEKLEPFIDDEMMAILTEIYGESWKTRNILALCNSSIKTVDENYMDNYPTNTEKVSFLRSLNEKTPLNMCAAEALKYRTHYKQNKDQLMNHLFKLFNQNVFDNNLDTTCHWNKKLTCTAGRCINIKRKDERTSTIELSDKVLTSAERMTSTLIHEMCHAAAWIFSGQNGHGKHWKSWTNCAEQAFPELSPITVCHRYEISFKYTYQCILCKARYNAHSRSKKIENIRCAYCYGEIELFLNKKKKCGETIAIPVKKARGFAAFVKETYKQVRQTEESHAATMKILGQKFTELSTEEKTRYS